MTKFAYELENFKAWLEKDKTNRAGMEKYWEYFLGWYKERSEIWKATVELGMKAPLRENVPFSDLTEFDKEVEVLQTTIFIWKREVDSSQPRSKSSDVGSIARLYDLSYPKNENKKLTNNEQSFPKIPSKLKLKNEHSPDYLENSIEYYRKWQEAKKENEQLKSNFKQERSKNKEKIAELERKNMHSRFQKQEEQSSKMTDLLEQLPTQNQAKDTAQTFEKATQTNFDWNKELKQKDLKIEKLLQQLIEQNKLSTKIDFDLSSSWANLPTGTLSPSQIREREKKKRQQEKSAQIQVASPSKILKYPR